MGHLGVGSVYFPDKLFLKFLLTRCMLLDFKSEM